MQKSSSVASACGYSCTLGLLVPYRTLASWRRRFGFRRPLGHKQYSRRHLLLPPIASPPRAAILGTPALRLACSTASPQQPATQHQSQTTMPPKKRKAEAEPTAEEPLIDLPQAPQATEDTPADREVPGLDPKDPLYVEKSRLLTKDTVFLGRSCK